MDDRIVHIWAANEIVIVIDLPLMPMPFLRHSRFFTQESAMGQVMSEGIATLWTFPDPKEHRSGGRLGAIGQGIPGEGRDSQDPAKW